MGFTSFGGTKFMSKKDFVQNKILQPFETEPKHKLVEGLSHSVTGNLVYVCTECPTDNMDHPDKTDKIIWLFKLAKDEDGWGYRDMTVFDGPVYFGRLPKKMIDWFMKDNALLHRDSKTVQWALDYIRKCQDLKKRRTKADVRIGDHYLYEHEGEELRLVVEHIPKRSRWIGCEVYNIHGRHLGYYRVHSGNIPSFQDLVKN